MVVPARRRVARRASLQRVLSQLCERRAAAASRACDENALACVLSRTQQRSPTARNIWEIVSLPAFVQMQRPQVHTH
jgi:hypothetical protein